MKSVNQADIIRGLSDLKIDGSRVVIHSSLSSFGTVSGGADEVIAAVQKSFKTVLMPAFCWDSNTAPPENDRPCQNGCDYSFYDNWQKPPRPFIIGSAGIEKSMGIIAGRFILKPGVYRSDHAWHSWAAWGDRAKQMTDGHNWDTTNLPLERLSELGGNVVLIGVGLKSCTAIHIAEERAGRRPFIRWTVDRQGVVRRVRASGCAKGFNNLMPRCRDLFKTANIGQSQVLAASLPALIERATDIIRENPEITRCSPDCLRCRDAILGGPRE